MYVDGGGAEFKLIPTRRKKSSYIKLRLSLGLVLNIMDIEICSCVIYYYMTIK